MTTGLAIAGLGMTPMGKVYGRSAAGLAADAIAAALTDAGLDVHDLDGLLVNGNRSPDMSPMLQGRLGLRDLGAFAVMSAYGSTVGTMLQYAAHLVASERARAVALVYADAPLAAPGSSGHAYASRSDDRRGLAGLKLGYGLSGPNGEYAMAARRHMHRFGTTSEQLGAIAVSTRAWATLNPVAQMRTPITVADHQASRMIVDPLHLLDCCLVSNGAIAVVVTSEARARDLRQPVVRVLAAEQHAVGDDRRSDREPQVDTGAKEACGRALGRAGLTRDDVDVLELYDCYTYTVLATLEDYGFCAKGEGGAFVEGGTLGPGGALPTNTGGGQLSGYYMWGMTPLSEGIVQARGQGGERQVDGVEIVLVSGNGGILEFHSTMVLAAT